MVTLPVMMSSNDKGIDTTLIQEAIFGASAELNQILSYRWDENSIDKLVDPNEDGLAEVIQTSYNDCDTNTSSPTYGLRPGHIMQKKHRKCLLNFALTPTPAGSFGPESGDLDDIDDVNTSVKSLFINYTASLNGYKQDFKSNVNISYDTMGGLVGTNDAKKVTVIVTDAAGNTVTKLTSYTLNIGEVDIDNRIF